MKVESTGSKKIFLKNGSSILEALIAISLLTLGIAASILLAFANQSIKLDSETSGEALYKANDVLENARAASMEDFNSIISTAAVIDGIYSKKFDVIDSGSTPCRKEVISRVMWSTEANRPQKIELKSGFVDVGEAMALGGDCVPEPSIGGWTLPTTLGSIDLGTGKATGIDVMNKIVFLSVEDPAVAKPDFFVVDATDGSSPIILSTINTGPSLNAVDTARDRATGKIFAYVANNNISQQLQIIDATILASPVIVGFANLEPAPLGTDSEGRSIYFYDKKIYIGTSYLPSLGLPRPEFHIFDVSDPTHPIELGSYDVNHNINNIIVRGDYAYLATSDNAGELWMLNVSNSASPTFVNKFNALGNEDGDSIYLVGNTLYLGRDQAPSSRPDFYVLNVENPVIIDVLGSKNLSMDPSTAKVSAIHVNGRFAFLATGDSNQEFQVLDISNPASIPSPVSTYNFPQEATGVDFDNNIIYSSVRSNDALRIIRPAQCADRIDDDGDTKIDSADPQCHTDGDATNAASYNTEDDSE